MQKHVQWTSLLLALAVVAVIGFGIWCAELMVSVGELRAEIGRRVSWLETVHEAQVALQMRPGETDELLAHATALQDLAAEVAATDGPEDEVATGAFELARDYDQIVRQGRVRDLGRITTINADIADLVPAMRRKTGDASYRLWEYWSSLNLLIFISLGLAASTLGLLLYARFIALERASRTVDRLHKQLLHADRLAAVGTLAAGVAHEVNNPMTYVISNLRLLQRSLDGPGAGAEVQELIEDALSGAERVTAIVRDLQSFANPGNDQLGPVEVRACLEAAVKIAGPQLRNRIQVERDYEDVAMVRGNETRLGQVFLNLVINAAHAMEHGEPSRNRLRLAIHPTIDGNVLVEVADTGTGIPADVRERVFEPFVTTKPTGKGTGLGLFVCHGVVMSMGGTIEIDSSSAGTVIRIRLPALEESEVQSKPHKKPRKGRALKVLIVDDEPLVVAALARALQQHEVTSCQTARTALAKIREQDFDVVLCDLMMSDLNGAELHERVREIRPHVAERFLFITGDTLNDAARTVLEQMPERLLHKPFNADELRDAVEGMASTSSRM